MKKQIITIIIGNGNVNFEVEESNGGLTQMSLPTEVSNSKEIIDKYTEIIRDTCYLELKIKS